jgi:hypothetical protein
LADTHRRVTCRAWVARRKGHGRTGPTEKADQGQCWKGNLERSDHSGRDVGRNLNATTAWWTET